MLILFISKMDLVSRIELKCIIRSSFYASHLSGLGLPDHILGNAGITNPFYLLFELLGGAHENDCQIYLDFTKRNCFSLTSFMRKEGGKALLCDV